jgi:hypothetical protein
MQALRKWWLLLSVLVVIVVGGIVVAANPWMVTDAPRHDEMWAIAKAQDYADETVTQAEMKTRLFTWAQWGATWEEGEWSVSASYTHYSPITHYWDVNDSSGRVIAGH